MSIPAVNQRFRDQTLASRIESAINLELHKLSEDFLFDLLRGLHCHHSGYSSLKLIQGIQDLTIVHNVNALHLQENDI